MADLLLHHYPNSPFAEKVRAILGYKGLAWKSVVQPVIMPKPDLQTLTGGYRRIPVLQVGSDIFCDTALICDYLEALAPTPSLFPGPGALEAQARILAQWADSTVFAAAMAYNFSPAGSAYFFRDAPPDQARQFAEDRKAMRGGAARMLPAEAIPAFRNYLGRAQQLLQGRPFLLSDQPCLADFALYHPIWFTKRVEPLANILDDYDQINPWLARMMALGARGEQLGTPMSSAEAIQVARLENESKAESSFNPLGQVFVDMHGLGLGSQVVIVAESFGLEESRGTLLSASADRITIERHDAVAGKLRVHFPRLGFVMKAAS